MEGERQAAYMDISAVRVGGKNTRHCPGLRFPQLKLIQLLCQIFNTYQIYLKKTRELQLENLPQADKSSEQSVLFLSHLLTIALCSIKLGLLLFTLLIYFFSFLGALASFGSLLLLCCFLLSQVRRHGCAVLHYRKRKTQK